MGKRERFAKVAKYFLPEKTPNLQLRDLRRTMHYSTIIDVLFAQAEDKPDALIYDVDHDQITYGQLLEDVLRVAKFLSDKGVERGDRCALILPTSLDFIRALYAAQMLGAIPVAINPGLPPELIFRRLNIILCNLVISQGDISNELNLAAEKNNEHISALSIKGVAEFSPAINRSVIKIKPNDTAYLQFTSGTTGEPRAAVVTHRSLVACIKSSFNLLEIKPDDILISWVPLFYDLGLIRFIFSPPYFGCPVYLLQPSIKNLRNWLETASRVRATITGGVDFAYRIAARIVDPKGIDLGALRIASDGGEPVRRSTIESFEKRFGLSGVIRPGFGLAEATLAVTCVRSGEPLREDVSGNLSCGRPYEGYEIKIIDENGKDLQPGLRGEILVRGEAVFSGYFDNVAATKKVLKNDWLHTGDIGSIDKDGYLYVLGRKRALIKRAGALIIPREIEEATDRIKEIRFSAAIGYTPETGDRTEQIVVVAEIRPEASPSEPDRSAIAAAIVKAVTMAIGFSPYDVVLVTPGSIPRTQNGKIRYDELRRLYSTDGPVLREAILYGGRGDRV